MRTKPGVDTLSFDDLYNNLRVFEFDVKGSIASSSGTQNVAFVSSDNTNSTNEDEHKAMVTIDGEAIDWTGHAEDDTEDYALMAFNSSNSGSHTEMSAKDKFGLGYGSQIHNGVLSYKNEVFESVFDSRSSDVEDSFVNDRFAKVERMHAVPPPMIGNYMTPKSNFEIDESKFTYVLVKKHLKLCLNQLNLNPKVVNKPNVWSDAPIIEEYESDSDDEYVSKALVEQEKPSCAFINTIKHVKTPRQTTQDQDTCSQNPKVDKRYWNGLKSKKLGLGYGFTKKACFVCGSFSHPIRDCDFYVKRMAKQVALNKQKGKSTGPKENRPVWNNVQRLNQQNKFVPTTILTKTGRFPINAARQKFSSQTASPSTARKVNTARPIVNENRPRHNMY
nr:ribonuclease H-like domain, Gag-pre-integrase domain protein [Tanacetum cinerariifolium]